MVQLNKVVKQTPSYKLVRLLKAFSEDWEISCVY